MFVCMYECVAAATDFTIIISFFNYKCINHVRMYIHRYMLIMYIVMKTKSN